MNTENESSLFQEVVKLRLEQVEKVLPSAALHPETWQEGLVAAFLAILKCPSLSDEALSKHAGDAALRARLANPCRVPPERKRVSMPKDIPVEAPGEQEELCEVDRLFIRTLVAGLPKAQQRAVTLRIFEGLSFSTIGKEHQWSRSAAHEAFVLAKELLRPLLEKAFSRNS